MLTTSWRLSFLAAGALLALSPSANADNWPQWRGPAGNSTSAEQHLPLHWGEKTNIAWKCPLPGQAASTPAIWGNAIFVTSQQGEALLLLKIDKATGHIEWMRQVGSGSPGRLPLRAKKSDERREQKFHQLHNMASPSPVTDGALVIAHFGNGDLAAYDFAGRQLWLHNLQKEYGAYTIWWGHANSPVLVDDLVISVCMQDSLADLGGEPSASYLVAHDKRTGQEKWKTLRKTQAVAEQCDAYTTPILHATAAGTEVILMGGNQIDAYDARTGKQLWFLPGLTGGRTITGPTLGEDLVYATQGMRGPLLAVRLGASGQLAASSVAWKQAKGTPDSSCPVVSKSLVYWATDDGIVYCCDAQTGALKWKERLPGDYKATPLCADGRLYFLNRSGRCTVLAAAPRFEKLAENQLDDEMLASPAVSDGVLFFRGHKTLYAIDARAP